MTDTSASLEKMLGALTDGDVFQQRMAELKRAEQAASEKLVQAERLAGQSADAKRLLAQTAKMLAEHDDRLAGLEEREAALAEREQKVAETEKTKSAEYLLLAARERRIEQREQEVNFAQTKLAEAKVQVENQLADMAKARDLAASLVK